MSINPLNSVSVYELYYIQQANSPKKKEVTEQVETEQKPQENQVVNKQPEVSPETLYENRPWAYMIELLDLKFNSNPEDDIRDITKALQKWVADLGGSEGIEDEIADLEDYVKSLYVSFTGDSTQKLNSSKLRSTLNKIGL